MYEIRPNRGVVDGFFFKFIVYNSFQSNNLRDLHVKHMQKRNSMDIQPIIMPFTSEDFTTTVSFITKTCSVFV